jgi:hypothetical protein
MTMVEPIDVTQISDEIFRPANERPRGAGEGEVGRANADLALVSIHNDKLPVAKPEYGTPPTQHQTIEKPTIEVEPNYVGGSGVGSGSVAPNTKPDRVWRDSVTGERYPDSGRKREQEGIYGPETLES